jgi:N-acetylglucosaminyl-diphospho-decaprenol L-rhamnosyltransferase
MWKSIDMSEGGNRVAVSIVHFGEAELTLAAVSSWRKCTDVPIFVVSNAPEDQTLKLAATISAVRDVEVVALPENIGYGAAHNRCIAISRDRGFDWLALANNDLVVEIPSQQAFESELMHLDRVCAIAGCRVEENGETIDGGGHLQLFLARASSTDMNGMLPYVHGAFMMLRLATGLSFDERFFLYFEDLDLALQARKRGLTLAVLNSVSARHLGGASTGSTRSLSNRGDIVAFHASRSAILLYRKHFSLLVPLAILARLTLGLALLLRGRNSSALAGIRAGLARSPRFAGEPDNSGT